MYIDITEPPSADLAREKKRHLRLSILLFGLVLFAVLLGIIRVVFDTGHDTILENLAIALFVGAGFCFVYCTEKLQAHKPLNKEQQSRIEDLCRKNRQIAAYCDRVAAMNRKLIAAEYEAITAHADKAKAAEKGTRDDGHTSSPGI